MHNLQLEIWSGITEHQVNFSDEYSKIYLDIKIEMGLLTNKLKIVSIRNEK